MRTVFEEEEEDLAPLQAQPDRELTLSSTTLLAIFFGLVLICGLFFGLGYSLGRRATSESTADAGLSPAASATPTSVSSDYHQKPSAAEQTAAPVVPAQDASEMPPDSQSITPSDTASSPAQPAAAPVNSAPPSAAPASAQAKPVALQTAVPAGANTGPNAVPAAVQAAPGSGVMVQIAAVSNPADADVLIGALQKRGYTVAARRQPGDALIHVQVGPFSSRADAVAMRQKLLGDGYNAILK